MAKKIPFSQLLLLRLVATKSNMFTFGGNSGINLAPLLNSLNKCQPCDDGFTHFMVGNSTKCLKLMPEQPKISEAAERCSKLKTKLPLPKSKKEATDLYSFFHKKMKKNIIWNSNSYFPIDLSDTQNEGNFVSSTGENTTFENWPKSYKADTRKNYVAMGPNGEWLNTNSEQFFPFICQYEPNPKCASAVSSTKAHKKGACSKS